MISSEYTFNAAKLYVYDESNKLVESLNHPFWQKHSGIKYELKALLENNIIKEAASCFFVPLAIIYDSLENVRSGIDEEEKLASLSEEFLVFFEVPSIGLGNLEIQSEGAFRSNNFRLTRRYRLKEGGHVPITTSPLLEDGSHNIKFLLSAEQNESCKIISEHEETGHHDQETNFRIGGKLRKLCDICNDIHITWGRLQKEQIEDISEIRPRFSPAEDGGIDLGFDLDSGDNEEFEKLVNSSPPFQDILTSHGTGTERKRYILNEQSKKAVNSYRRKSHFSRDEKHLLFEQPEVYFEGFNLDDYSERVVGYGVLYAPKISPFTGEDGTEWINVDLQPLAPDSDSEGPEETTDGATSFTFNKEKASAIQGLIDEAEATGSTSIIIDGNEILITEDLKNAVQKQIKSEPYGLIAKSNIDEKTYSESPELIDILVRPKSFNLSLPEIFSSQYILKDYQDYGYGWLNWIQENPDLSGCLLADDMGMGKTIQICALFGHLKTLSLLKTSLLILPPILMGEWEKELGKFVPSISYYSVRSSLVEEDIEALKDYDLVAITYHSLLRNQKILGKLPFKVIVCDEVQFIKNPASARTQAVLSMNGECKIAATATPIENSISELWAILDFSNPGYLPPLREFNKRYGDRQVSDEVFGENVDNLKNQLSPIVLRRTKDEFLKSELYGKKIETHLCDIDEQQAFLNRKIIQAFKEDKTISNFLHFFQLIVMALTNPELLDGAYDIAFSTDYISPKLSKTIEILTDIRNKNEKVLLFADRKKVQWKLQEIIEANFGVKANIINGETPSTLRTQYTAPFRPDGDVSEGFDVLILSPRCAGFGLNLVQANHVIHYLRSFNPAVENQATDRVYRIGQNKPVFVHNLVASTDDTELGHTVEQKLDDMIQRKQAILKDYMYASRASRISEEEVAEELNLGNPGMSLSEIDALTPIEFEVFTAVLYSCQGYQSSLTPQNDFGADCVAVGHSNLPNVLLQCKKKMIGSKSRVGNSAVQEIVAARKEYERQRQLRFEELVAITNGSFTNAARIQASSNNVKLIDRNKLSELIKIYSVTRSAFNDYLRESHEC